MEDNHLFFAKKNRILDNEQHLAEMVSLMGPPPPEFLRRSENCHHFWDEKGMFYSLAPYNSIFSHLFYRELEGLCTYTRAITGNTGATVI